MAVIVYSLCTLTAALCAGLLWNAYLSSRNRLLLWSALCFIGLALNNILLVFDKLILPSVDFSPWRSATSLLAMSILLYGMITDSE
jgi:hypothetical protein